jgi:uncharacterized protein (TIGR03083 family)
VSEPPDDAASLYLDAATTFADVVADIDASVWEGPGLGAWDLRGLVGHTSRALVTVLTYLDQPADAEAIDSPEQYYALAARQSTDADAVAERGRRAGEDLGAEPAEAVRHLVERVRTKVDAADPEAMIAVLGGGMRVGNYLPTRTFELVVHSLDIGAATGIDVPLSLPVLGHTAALGARIAVALGQGQVVLTALTGRRPLPAGFSVVG